MNKSHTPRIGRNSERGAIAILIAAMWTTLFGLAALAVDVGYLYTRQRGLQAVTDAAVTAAMPTYQQSGFNPARNRATAVASANGYTTTTTPPVTTVTVDEPVANQFRVRVARTFPTFFGSLFGMSTEADHGDVGRPVAGHRRPGDSRRQHELLERLRFHRHGRRDDERDGRCREQRRPRPRLDGRGDRSGQGQERMPAGSTTDRRRIHRAHNRPLGVSVREPAAGHHPGELRGPVHRR